MPNRIRQLREERKLSLAQLATAIFGEGGDTKSLSSQLAKIERGDTQLNLLWMRRIAPVLGVAPAELLSDEDNPLRLRDAQERAIVTTYRGMTPLQQRQTAGMLAVLEMTDAA